MSRPRVVIDESRSGAPVLAKRLCDGFMFLLPGLHVALK